MSKIKRLFACFCMCIMCSIVTFSSVAYATNTLIPYESQPAVQDSTPGAGDGQGNNQTNEDIKYAEDIFTVGELKKTDAADSAVETVSNIASIILTFVVGVVPILLTIQILIDIVCILLKPAAVALSHAPIQITSDEEIMITGIQFVGGTGQGEAQSTSIEKVDLKGENPVLFYLKRRLVTIILSVTMCILLSTGVLFNVIFWVSNHIVSWVAGLISG